MMLKQPEDQDEKLLLRYATDDYARFEFDVSSTIGDDSSVRAIGFSQRYGDAADLDQDDADVGSVAVRVDQEKTPQPKSLLSYDFYTVFHCSTSIDAPAS